MCKITPMSFWAVFTSTIQTWNLAPGTLPPCRLKNMRLILKIQTHKLRYMFIKMTVYCVVVYKNYKQVIGINWKHPLYFWFRRLFSHPTDGPKQSTTWTLRHHGGLSQVLLLLQWCCIRFYACLCVNIRVNIHTITLYFASYYLFYL